MKLFSPRDFAKRKRLPETRYTLWANESLRLVPATTVTEPRWATTRPFTTALSYAACNEGRWKRFLSRASPKGQPTWVKTSPGEFIH